MIKNTGTGSIDNLPILSVRKPLYTSEEVNTFVFLMYQAYNKIQQELENKSYVDMDIIKCTGCCYSLRREELNRNMYRIRDSKL